MKSKIKYCIAASDLDGTLLGADQLVSRENMIAIAEMKSLGVELVPATGRALGEIPLQLRESPYIRYLLTSDGAAVWDKEVGEMVITNYIPRDAVDLITEMERKYNTYTVVHADGGAYYDLRRHRSDILEECRIDAYFQKIITSTGIPITDYESFVAAEDKIETFVIFFADDAEREECRRILLDSGRLTVSQTAKNNLEIYFSEAGKGKALRALAARLGVDISSVIAVGDGANDVELVSMAGLGLAMQNACDELKAIADEVICHYSEHNVKYILEKFIKG